jgi:thymidylate synthase (FAD)
MDNINNELFPPIKVLDKGYVKYIDHMGNDERVIFAARRSTEGSGKKKSDDEHLMDYLIRNAHNSVQEHCIITVEIKAPIFVLRQIMRARTASPSELSLRYSGDADLDFYVPSEERIKESGYTGPEDEQSFIQGEFHEHDQDSYWLYKRLLNETGINSELARSVLPVSMYSNVLLTIDLRNMLHFLNLRMDEHTQWETRQYALAIFSIVKELYPKTVASWENHVFHSITFSRDQWKAMFEYIMHHDDQYFFENVTTDMNKRDKRIFLEKVGIKNV